MWLQLVNLAARPFGRRLERITERRPYPNDVVGFFLHRWGDITTEQYRSHEVHLGWRWSRTRGGPS